MISGKLAVYNLALNAIGNRSNLSSPDQRSREAEVCNLWFEVVRDQILAAAPWPEATRVDRLALYADATSSDGLTPRAGYAFAYSYPNDLLRPQYLTTFEHFLITSVGASSILSTNQDQAILAYTFRQTLISSWSSELQMAVVYALAAHICMPLTGKQNAAKMLVDKANQYLSAARETASNTSNETLEYIPDWIAARGYCAAPSRTEYRYPNGPMIGLPYA